MITLLDKLNEAFEDIFQPASKEEINKRNEADIARLVTEAEAWFKVHGKEIKELALALSKIIYEKNKLRRKASILMDGESNLIWAHAKSQGYPSSRVYDYDDESLVDVLKVIGRFKVDDETKALAQDLAKRGL